MSSAAVKTPPSFVALQSRLKHTLNVDQLDAHFVFDPTYWTGADDPKIPAVTRIGGCFSRVPGRSAIAAGGLAERTRGRLGRRARLATPVASESSRWPDARPGTRSAILSKSSCLHGLVEIVERGGGVPVERLRVAPPQPERVFIIIPENASCYGHRFAQRIWLRSARDYWGRRIVVGCYEGIFMFPVVFLHVQSTRLVSSVGPILAVPPSYTYLRDCSE